MAERRPVMKKPSFVISGGGTGGHIFPAVAIANGLRKRFPDADILFVGAEGKMEMEKVPAAGYPIVGLRISGIRRSLSLSNLAVPFRMLSALWKARQILKKAQPDVVIGVGGYASSAVVYAASGMGIPTLIQEQNSLPGITNKILSKRVNRICVAYDGLEKYFPAQKIVYTGNPVRQEISMFRGSREALYTTFGLQADKFTVLAVGGSLGARSINEAMLQSVRRFVENGMQVIWQTGKGNAGIADGLDASLKASVKVFEFLTEMQHAYAIADVVVSRAGALAVSELCLVRKPCILVPFPFAAEDHQTFNAKALSEKGAAVLLRDDQVREKLSEEILALYGNPKRREEMQERIAAFGRPYATELIVDEIVKLRPQA
jgi:UDP-N-acetylglucosamine--N-acetylmuramyl-(pentapeptide) pyrophosphoryl-undecaprenol N-acetylglucosamine transferase